MKNQYSQEQQKEIEEMAFLVKDLVGVKNRLKIWVEIRESGMRGDVALEVLRELGLFEG